MKNHKIKRRMPTLNTYKSHLFGKLFSDKQVYNFLRTIVACQKKARKHDAICPAALCRPCGSMVGHTLLQLT